MHREFELNQSPLGATDSLRCKESELYIKFQPTEIFRVETVLNLTEIINLNSIFL